MQHSSLTMQNPDAGFAPILVSYACETTGRQIPDGHRRKAMDGDEGEFERNGLPAPSLGASRHAPPALSLSVSNPPPVASAKEANKL